MITHLKRQKLVATKCTRYISQPSGKNNSTVILLKNPRARRAGALSCSIKPQVLLQNSCE